MEAVHETQSTTESLGPSHFEVAVIVKAAARFLGISPSLVYAYVERKQIPHFRMMGRSIRFSLSELGGTEFGRTLQTRLRTVGPVADYYVQEMATRILKSKDNKGGRPN